MAGYSIIQMIYGRALFVLQKFVFSISTTVPAGQIVLNERVAGIVKPSAGASNKGRPEGDFIC